jgi:nicotinate phosphoribosyltransferase
MAMKNNIKAIGTMSHQWLECGQVLTRVRDSQKFMFQKWAEVFRGDLGIALTDTLGIDAFIKDFDPYFCKLFDGVRQDSGSPYEWIEKIVKMYEGYGIDSKTKTAVFSDGLDIDEANKILKAVNGRMKVMFGIGTSLTNSVGHVPLNIVIKVVSCNGFPVAKISDSEGKAMCKDEGYLTYLKSQFGIK